MQRQPDERTPLLPEKKKSDWAIRHESTKQMHREIRASIQAIRSETCSPIFDVTIRCALPIAALITLISLTILQRQKEHALCQGSFLNQYNQGNGTWPESVYPSAYYNGSIPTNYTCGDRYPLTTVCQNPSGPFNQTNGCNWLCSDAAYRSYKSFVLGELSYDSALNFYNNGICDGFCGTLFPLSNLSNWLNPVGYIQFVCYYSIAAIYDDNELKSRSSQTSGTYHLFVILLSITCVLTTLIGIVSLCNYGKPRRSVNDLSEETQTALEQVNNKLFLTITPDMNLSQVLALLKRQERDIYKSLSCDVILNTSRRPGNLLNRLFNIDTEHGISLQILRYAGFFRDPQLKRERQLAQVEEIVEQKPNV